MSNVIYLDAWRREQGKIVAGFTGHNADNALEEFGKVLDMLEKDLFEDAIKMYGKDVAKIAEALNRSESEISEYIASKGI